MLEKIKENIISHKAANNLLRKENISDLYEIHHEFHINWEFMNIKCKSLLDSIAFDFENKICTIMDLKTTQKLWHFEDSIEQYDYCRQLAYYTMAAKWYLKNERNENTENWDFKWYIIGIDTTGTYDVRVFKFDEYDIQSKYNIIYKTLSDIGWHIVNDKWSHSRGYYEGDGSESLNL